MIENFGIGYILKAPKSLIYNPQKTNDVLHRIIYSQFFNFIPRYRFEKIVEKSGGVGIRGCARVAIHYRMFI